MPKARAMPSIHDGENKRQIDALSEWKEKFEDGHSSNHDARIFSGLLTTPGIPGCEHEKGAEPRVRLDPSTSAPTGGKKTSEPRLR